MRITALIAAWWILAMLFWGGCTNPFHTRSAETPDSSSDGLLLAMQLEPDSLMRKMELAFERKEPQYYNELFYDSYAGTGEYTFVPQELYQEVLTGWSKEDENIYFSNIIIQPDLVSVSLELNKKTDWIPVFDNPDSLEATYNYSVRLKYAADIRYYSGQSVFRVVKEQNYYLYYWKDLALTESNPDSTWSSLKYKFRVQ